jgi:aminoglycoside phosphotransferase (APT) family kinase protein
MTRDTERLRVLVEAELRRHHSALNCGPLSTAGTGLECIVFRATSTALGELAIRVPWERWISNDNDPALDARDLLRQEAALLKHVASAGVPTPAVHQLHLSDRCDFLLTEYVEQDDSMVDWFQVGAATRRLHELEPPSLRPVAQEAEIVEHVLAERLVRRLGVVKAATGLPPRLPDANQFRHPFSWPGARRALLHMDIRPANLLTRCGDLRGVVDWSNALIGDPALELARIAEYGLLTREFLAGYGEQTPFADVPSAAELLFRLDTAVMLAVVFLFEAPEARAAQRQLARIEWLLAQFAEASQS